MEIAKTILIVIYFIVCLALIILTMTQNKEDAGLSSRRTKEGRKKKWTIILGITFAVLTIVLGILYVA